jgi:hypothetical protein
MMGTEILTRSYFLQDCIIHCSHNSKSDARMARLTALVIPANDCKRGQTFVQDK